MSNSRKRGRRALAESSHLILVEGGTPSLPGGGSLVPGA